MRTDRERRTDRRLLSAVATLGVLVGASLTAGPAAAAPNDSPQAVRVDVVCEGASTTIVMHPGGGKALWDVSTGDAANGPDYLIKSLTGSGTLNGEPLGPFSFSFGKRVGQGAPITCAFHEEITDPETGDLLVVDGVAQDVRLPNDH